jgi:hypothetical protein
MNLTRARFAAYIGSALAGGAFLLSAFGYAEYDAGTGLVDIAPFNVYALAAVVAGPLASAMAAVAVWFGWGKGK